LERKCEKWISDLRQTKTEMIVGPFYISPNTFHQRKCFVFVIICNLYNYPRPLGHVPAYLFSLLLTLRVGQKSKPQILVHIFAY